MKISKKQKAVLKSYARGVLVSFLTFLASNELGLDPAVSVIVAALAGPAARALDKSDSAYGIGANEAWHRQNGLALALALWPCYQAG